MNGKTVVIALGGNALGSNLEEQKKAVEKTAKVIADLVEDGVNLVITHGNGPQVGMIQDAMDTLATEKEGYGSVPLPVSVAMSQGYIGIGLQNFPEGAIISMPLKSEGISKPKAFLYGVLSGIVEPISAIITIILISVVVPILPYLLAFAGGAMIYVVVEELIPESQAGNHSNIGTIGVALGFVIMMILDVGLG